MNKFYIIIFLWSILSCGSSKKTTSTVSTNTTKTTTIPATTSEVPITTPTQNEPTATAPVPIVDVVPSVVMNSESLSGKILYETKCNTCHTFKRPNSKTVEQWQKIVPNMVNMANKTKMMINDEEKKLILEYLVALNKK